MEPCNFLGFGLAAPCVMSTAASWATLLVTIFVAAVVGILLTRDHNRGVSLKALTENDKMSADAAKYWETRGKAAIDGDPIISHVFRVLRDGMPRVDHMLAIISALDTLDEYELTEIKKGAELRIMLKQHKGGPT